jgi:pimeloyl-ACP methyl ester carboxylesterase
LDEVGRDLRYGVRTSLRNQGFTLVVVLTLAIGIGANAATTLGRLYATRRPGYGASSRPESGYDIASARTCSPSFKTLGLPKLVLIGHSLAGQEMSALASQHRDQMAALIYLDAAKRYAYDVPGEFEKDFPLCVEQIPGSEHYFRRYTTVV